MSIFKYIVVYPKKQHLVDVAIDTLAFFITQCYYLMHEIRYSGFVEVYLRLTARYNPSSLGHSVAQARLALGIKTSEAKSELLRSDVLIPSFGYTTSLAHRGVA